MQSLKNAFYAFWAALTGKNLESTPKSLIAMQLTEPRPLPMGITGFEEWSDRIISGAVIPFEEGFEDRHIINQKYMLANMILHLGPTESHKPDAFFIHSLRKYAANQVADAVRKGLYEAKEKKSAVDAEAS